MDVLSKMSLDQLPLVKSFKESTVYTKIPVIDLQMPDSRVHIIEACKEFGFFKVTNHGIPVELMTRLKYEVMKFFSLTQLDKEKFAPPNQLGYGDKKIGRNGDIGWIEYLLMACNPGQLLHEKMPENFRENHELLFSALSDYISAVTNLACEILEILAVGLELKPKDSFSKLLRDRESNSLFRINHCPPCPDLQIVNGFDLIGFGEHTDPQIMSVQNSNDVEGYQILLNCGNWVSIQPDPMSFFINVGDLLQVMTNGRLKSVKHRVLANPSKSRLSMIYFVAPPLSATIKPVQIIMEEGERSKYEEFTWDEYQKAAIVTKLAHDRLSKFEKK